MIARRVCNRWAFAFAACGLVLGAARSHGDEGNGESQVLDAIQQQVLSIFGKAQTAIVRVEATDVDDKLFGTGFFIDPDGTLLTSYSVGGEAQHIIVMHGDERYPAKRLISDARSGVAILKIEAQTSFLTLGKSRDLTIASPVLAIGFPMDLPLTPTFGIVGGFDIKYLGRYFATAHIRANLPVQRGQGGAPLLNMRGEAVGMLISSLDNGSASFVLPIEAAQKVQMDYTRFHEMRPGWMGIQVGIAEEPESGSSAQIQGLVKDSPGEKSGLRTGDILVGVGDRKITSPEDVITASYFLTADDEVMLKIVRDDEPVDIKLRPTDHPQFHRLVPSSIGSANDLLSPTLKMDR